MFLLVILIKDNGYLPLLAQTQNYVSINIDDSFPYSEVEITGRLSLAEVWDYIPKKAGATKPYRDDVDLIVLRSIELGLGNYVDCVDKDELAQSILHEAGCQNESLLGEWPKYESISPPVDSDGDGLPDYWEEKYELDKYSALDGKLSAGNNYTNLELYLHYLASD